MTVICPNCGTPNEDTHRFCSNCATPLPGPAAPMGQPQVQGAPAAFPPPPPPTTSAVTPAAAPPPPPPAWPSAPTPSRLSRNVLIGGVVAGLVVAVGVALIIVFVLGGGHGDNGTGVGPTPTPTFRPPGPTPTPRPPGPTATPIGPIVTPNPIVTATPSLQTPVPGTLAPITPGPIVTPTPGGGGGGGTTQTVDTEFVAVRVPSDWTVGEKTDFMLDIRRPGGGQLILLSGFLQNPVTVDAWVQDKVDKLKEAHTDFQFTVDTQDSAVPNGPPGKVFQVAYTAQTQSGDSYTAVATFFVAIDQNNVLYMAEIYCNATINPQVVEDMYNLALPNIVWKQFQAG